MATTYIFESSTQAQATAFTSADTLTFQSTPVNVALTASYTAGTTSAQDTITLTAGSQTLTFVATQLTGASNASDVKFIDANSGTVVFGSTAGDTLGTTALPAGFTTDKASAFFGFDGNDTITIGGTGAHVVDAGSGTDTITTTASASGAYYLQGGDGADTIDATLSGGNLHIWGNTAAAVAGATDGADSIIAGYGSNYVNGNAGNDVISVANAPNGSTAGVNRLFGGSGNDTISGGVSNDTINGNAGNDVIDGGAGNDYLRGGQGNDSIVGGAGNDQLLGDLGNDTLVGGVGIDVLTGGAGADVFRFTATQTTTVGGVTTAGVSDAGLPSNGFVDLITDFSKADGDKIDLQVVTTASATNPNPVTANLIFVTDATFNTEAAAQSYANSLLFSSNTANSTSVHDIVAIQVGSDTFLFSHETGGTLTSSNAVDTVIKLQSFTANTLNSADFI